ncbi:MAG: hypothetical protein PHR28_12140 [candidate division Zixibacteria bacterium]|nr:hypothetical protein [candidate division Zixibacteria bacterium]
MIPSLRMMPLARNGVAVATSDSTIQIDITETPIGLSLLVRENADSIPIDRTVRIDRDLTITVEPFDETLYRDILPEIPA